MVKASKVITTPTTNPTISPVRNPLMRPSAYVL
jgi:hypothetical protein